MKAVVILIVWTVVVTLMSLLPGGEHTTYRIFPNEDKLAHFLMYLIMAFLLGKVVVGFQGKLMGKYLCILLLPSIYGYIMEILQGDYITGRQFDKFDIIANIIGSFAGTMLFYMLNTFRKKFL